ncbi:SDH family Clp fold serine proteinase [Neorhizobium alkalisoli]|uniref:SDH family Clp fold serine proteinase n=1 Tax=Neorhizobium alkalisoli TaxID=528178 RepID=UPI001646BD29|nr:hypothetical protein [Neorhizobium alkalisoli]
MSDTEKSEQISIETFPRGNAVPKQSPIFWAENKDRFLRQLMIRDIESLTGRPLGVYYAQRSMQSGITTSDVDRLHELVSDIDHAPFDLIVETQGGETDAAEAMISVLLAAKHPFRAIVPNRAKSNGTLICLASEAIVMGPPSELGPIEPLLDGKIPVTAIIGKSIPGGEGDDPESAFNINKFHAVHALRQTESVGRYALKQGMLKDSAGDIDEAIKNLCGRHKFPSHGSVIDATQAEEIGLKIVRLSSDDDLWQRIWLLYCMLMHDTKLRNIRKVFESKKVSLSVLWE